MLRFKTGGESGDDSSILDDSQYLLLTYQWHENDYEKEKERLIAIKNQYGEVTLDEDTFGKTAYVYMLNEGDNSEFAIADDEKMQMTYVYVQCPFDFRKEAYIDELENHSKK